MFWDRRPAMFTHRHPSRRAVQHGRRHLVSPFLCAVGGVSMGSAAVLATAPAAGVGGGGDGQQQHEQEPAPLPPNGQPLPQPQQKELESPLLKAAIGAGCTWVYEMCIGHELEFIKVAKQTAPDESYAALVQGITRHKGVLGLLDGFFPWGSIQAVAKGAVFSFAAAGARALVEPLVESDAISPLVAEVFAGGVGGGFQGFVLSPSLLLKTRVMTDPVFREDMSFSRTCRESTRVGMNVIRNEGVRALMKGSVVFASKRVADWSTRYFFSSMVERHLFQDGDPDKEISNLAKLASSLLGGTLSALVTIPIDVTVAQIQQASKAGEAVSVVQLFASQWKSGGFSHILKFATGGFVVRVAHVALTTALMKTMTSVVYGWVDPASCITA